MRAELQCWEHTSSNRSFRRNRWISKFRPRSLIWISPSLKHLKAFTELLTSADKAIREAIKLDGKECVFNPTVRQRGYNLYNGAYVLQLRVNNDEMDEWTVKYLVGASYSYEVHHGLFQDVSGQRCYCVNL